MLDLISIDFFEVGDLPAQVRRNITLNASSKTLTDLEDLQEGVQERGKRFFEGPETKSIFRKIAGFDTDGYDPGIVLGNKETGYSYLRGGSEVYRFVAIVEQKKESIRTDTVLRMIITGYTDRTELDNDGRPSDETLLHINSVMTLRVRMREDGRGNVREEYELVDNSLVVLPNRDKRDTEKYSTIATFADYVDDHEDGQDISGTILMGNEGNMAKTVRHSLSLPDNYFRTLANADLLAKEDKDHIYGVQDMDTSRNSFISSRLKSQGHEGGAGENSFIKALKNGNLDSFEAIRRDNAFELGDLLDSTCDDPRRGRDLVELTEFENTNYESENWKSGLQETIHTYDLCHRIPEVMLQCLIMGVSFRVSNLWKGRETGRVEPEFSFFEDVNNAGRRSYNIVPITGNGSLPDYFLDRFEDLIMEEIFLPISDYGETPTEITVYSTLSGVTRVEITYDDGDETPYVFASFCESRLSPHLISTDNDKFVKTVERYSSLRSHLDSGSMMRNSSAFESQFDNGIAESTTDFAKLLRGDRDKESGGRSLLSKDDKGESKLSLSLGRRFNR